MTAGANILVPRKPRGSRTFDAVNYGGNFQQFAFTRRTLGTSSFAVSLFFWATAMQRKLLLRMADTTKAINIVSETTGELTVQYGDGATLQTLSTPASTYAAATWYHLVVNVDRAGNLDIYVDDMTTAKATVSIAALSAVDYVSGNSTWRLAGYLSSTYPYWVGRMSRVGLVIGSTLSADDRTELHAAGAGLLYSGFSAGLLTTFTNQDYWNLDRFAGDEPNLASSARPLVQSAVPGSAGRPT